jgi:hypothetical protein
MLRRIDGDENKGTGRLQTKSMIGGICVEW